MVHVTITQYVAMYVIDSENVIFIIIGQWRLVLLWKCCWDVLGLYEMSEAMF